MNWIDKNFIRLGLASVEDSNFLEPVTLGGNYLAENGLFLSGILARRGQDESCQDRL